MIEHADVEERRQDVAAQSVPEKETTEILDASEQKEFKKFVDSMLTKIYSQFGNDIENINSVFASIVKSYNPSDKEFVGFLDYMLNEIAKRHDASFLVGSGMWRFFGVWRNDIAGQREIYRVDKDSVNFKTKKYYEYLNDNNKGVQNILNSFELVEKYWGAENGGKALDNLKIASEEAFHSKEAVYNMLMKSIDQQIDWASSGGELGMDDPDVIRYVSIKEWLINRRNNSNLTVSGKNVYEVFLENNFSSVVAYLYEFEEKNEKDYEHLIDSFFEKRYNERIAEMYKESDRYFHRANLVYLSAIEQVLKGGGVSSINEDFYEVVKNERLSFSVDEIYKVKNEVYDEFSYGDILGELIMSWDGKDGDKLEKLQWFSGIFANLGNLFKLEYNGKWNAATWEFLSMLRDDEDFRKCIHSDKYLAKINQILAANIKYKGQVDKKGYEKHYDTYSSFVEQQRIYWNNPVAYRRSQERGHREFVGVREKKSAYPSISSESQMEHSFISNSANQSSKLNGEIAKWLDMSGKTLEQQRDIEERLMHLIPKDKIHSVVDNLLSNPDIRRNFVEQLNMPEELLYDEMLFDRIINYETGDQQFEAIKERFFGILWKNKGDVIISFAGELSDFLKEQIGVSALNVRKDFLENIFGFSITSLELPGQKDDVFYFKDQYHPETVYEYRPQTGEIFAQESISLKDGEIFFNGGHTDQKRLIYTLKKYTEYLDGVDILGILPVGGDRPKSFESLQDQLSKNIQRYMHVDVGFTEVEGIHERNDSERMKNEIVDRAREILGITQGHLTESQDGPYYELLLTVINSVQDISRESLAEVRFFFEQFSDMMYDIRSGISINEDSIKNPLLKFVVEKTKDLENNGENCIFDVKTKKNWKEIDLAFGSILRELMYTDVDGKEKLRIGSIAYLNNAREGSPGHERFVQNVQKRYEQLSHPLLMLRDQELSSLDKWRNTAIQGVIKEIGSEVADLGHLVHADQKLDSDIGKMFELEFGVNVKIPNGPQNYAS